MHGSSRFPLWLQVAAAVGLGLVVGAVAGDGPIVLGIGTPQLGRLGMVVIGAIKALAVPLVLFTILDAILRHSIPVSRAKRLVAICAVNVTIALTIGLTLVNVLRPGDALRSYFAGIAGSAGAPAGSLDPIAGIESMIPKTVAQPFVENSVIGVVLLALLAGAALRRVRERERATGESGAKTIEGIVHTISECLQQALGWIILIVPFAAFGLVAHAVGRSGLAALTGLWAFLLVIVAAMALHALGWYSLVVWATTGRTPRTYLGAARDAIVTGVATNSSLATVPVTLRCLTEKLGVSEPSSRLAACVGTNLNNDGITLYEAIAVIIIAQACGFELGVGGQISVVFASIMAGIGIAGVPEAGLVMLPIVLSAAGLPDAVVAAAIPLVMPVDWVLARCRTVVNVLSDMLVAIVLDAPAAEPAVAPALENP